MTRVTCITVQVRPSRHAPQCEQPHQGGSYTSDGRCAPRRGPQLWTNSDGPLVGGRRRLRRAGTDEVAGAEKVCSVCRMLDTVSRQEYALPLAHRRRSEAWWQLRKTSETSGIIARDHCFRPHICATNGGCDTTTAAQRLHRAYGASRGRSGRRAREPTRRGGRYLVVGAVERGDDHTFGCRTAGRERYVSVLLRSGAQPVRDIG